MKQDNTTSEDSCLFSDGEMEAIKNMLAVMTGAENGHDYFVTVTT